MTPSTLGGRPRNYCGESCKQKAKRQREKRIKRSFVSHF